MARSTRTPDFDLANAIDQMPDAFVQCRDFQHSWRPHDVHWDAKARAYDQILRCSRCKTYRVRTIGRDGALISSHYEYPEHYLVIGMGRLTGTDRDAIRLASIMRSLPAVAMSA